MLSPVNKDVTKSVGYQKCQKHQHEHFSQNAGAFEFLAVKEALDPDSTDKLVTISGLENNI